MSEAPEFFATDEDTATCLISLEGKGVTELPELLEHLAPRGMAG
jgi:hypothetical protein